MIQEEQNYRPWPYRLLSAGLILPPAMLFTVTGDLPHIFLLTVTGLAFSLLLRRPVRYSDRAVIYTLVGAAILAVLLDLVFPMQDGRLGYVSKFFQPNILVPFLLYLAVGISLFRPHPRNLGIIIAAMLAIMVFGGDMFNTTMTSERLPFCTPLVHDIYRFFTVITIIETTLILLAISYCAHNASARNVPRWRRRQLLLKIIMLLLIPVIAVTCSYYYHKHGNRIRQWENYLLRLGMQPSGQMTGRIEFGPQVNLNTTITPDIRRNQAMILLQVKGPEAPGYLRDRVYHLYQDGTWESRQLNEERPAIREESPTGMIVYTSYRLADTPSNAKLQRFDVFPAGNFALQWLPLAGGFRRIDIIADRLQCTGDGEVQPQEWTKDGGYSYFTIRGDHRKAWPWPAVPQSPLYLQTPSELNAELDRFLLQAVPAVPGQELTDTQRIAALVGYLKAHFKYSLAGSDAAGQDPVLYFLRQSRQGHCELFAAATVLLLRRMGIPARYVTGFICEEQHPSQRYFVSRLGHAHAWVEAWPRERREWELVEPTPPGGIPNFHHQWGMLEPWKDRLGLLMRETLAQFRRGVVATAIIAAAAAVW
ncbi:MAG: transglutaminase-like domain-containing protein, partial [Victivallales bacterium]|nr:transglutaminase-like domain-containing protein [Victivallales bacterium]